MAKRGDSFLPWPDNVWHSSGRIRESSSLQAIEERLRTCAEDGSIASWREFTPADEAWWWGFDASWQTGDGDRIRARLMLAPDPVYTKTKGASREDFVVDSRGKERFWNKELFWTLTAEADRPWDPAWASPADVMLANRPMYDWVTGRMHLGEFTAFVKLDPVKNVQRALDSLVDCPWCITVITHDVRSLREMGKVKTSVLELVPPVLKGRLLEIRLSGDQDRLLNSLLPEGRARLKWGCALILPPRVRNEDWPLADYVIRRPPGGSMEQLLKETADTVTRYAELSPHFGSRVRDGVKSLREMWVLPELELAPARILRELEGARDRICELERNMLDLQGVLDDERKQAQLIYASREEAVEQLKELQGGVLARRAGEAEEQADQAWTAYDDSEARVETLTGEVAFLRRRLAQVPGGSYTEPAPEPLKGPESWDELLEFAPELLPKVRIGDVREPLLKLRGHTREATWLRRTWLTLEAYQAYADAKAEHGADVLPHMTAYLKWPGATAVFPVSWHASKEAALLNRDPKYTAMRTFDVPGLGEVFMQEHVRIGQGRPPLPRMHVYDDTRGPTKQVHIGYIGLHLPNGRD